MRLFIALANKMNYENTVALTSPKKRELEVFLAVSRRTLNNTLSRLSKTRFINRIETNIYMISPNYVFKGTTNSVDKRREIFDLHAVDKLNI
jgi:predicted transcriptional regulator of viral defense system